MNMRAQLKLSTLLAAGFACGLPALAQAEELSVVYRDSPYVSAVMEAAKAEFEAEHPGDTIELNAISSSARDYYTKVSLMNQSASTAPDIIYEDGFQITADAAAGYLEPLDERLSGWEEWDQFSQIAVQNGKSFVDGKVYGIPLGTDTQAIWYNKDLLEKAGVGADWQPKTWQDILDAAAKVKENLPGVDPINIYVTKAGNEASTMRGLMNLISGTPGGLSATLFDPETQKWVVGSKGFRDALAFLKTAYDNGYLVSDTDLQDSSFQNVLVEQRVPDGKVAMFIDGNWIWARWIESGTAPWAAWNETLGMAKIPTQNGQGNGFTSMSGGWTIAMSPKTDDKDLAFDFMTTVANFENSLTYAIRAGSIGVRKDVIADETYLETNPTAGFFSSLVEVTNFRPALEIYPQVSSLIQETMEAVTVGGDSVEDAAGRFDRQLTRLAGSSNVEKAN